MKRLFISCLLLAVLINARAADFNDGFFYYNVIDEDAKTAEVVQHPNGHYTFPAAAKFINASVNGYSIVAVGENALKDATGSLSGNYPFIWCYAPEIKAGAFDNCQINFVGLQAEVATLHPAAFKNNKLGWIRCNGSTFAYEIGSYSGILLNADKTRIIAVPGRWHANMSSTSAPVNNFTAPNTIAEIAAYAFYGNSTLNTVNLGSVQVIESEALANMTALRTLTIPATATTIAADAFQGTTGITTLNVNLSEPVPGVKFDDAVYNALRDKVNFGDNANVAAFQADPDWGKFFTKASDDVYILGEVDFNSWSPASGVPMV